MKTTFLLIAVGITIITVSFLLSKPGYNGSSPGCGGGSCHTFQDGDLSVRILDNLQVEITVSNSTSKVSGELIDENGTLVDVIESTSANPFILTAPSEGTFLVNAGYKRPSLKWDSSLVVLTGTVPDFLSVSPTSLTLGSVSGSNGQFSVSSNVGWSVSDDANWLIVSPTSGSNNGSVTVTTTSSNPSTSNSRNATVTLTGGPTQRTVSVSQNPFSPPGFPVDLFGTPETEKTITFAVSKPGNPPSTVSYNITAFDADHGGNDPPEGQAFINGNGPIDLFPGATQANGDGQTNDFTFSTPSSWWVDGNNELKFVRLLSTGYRIEAASVSFGVTGINDGDNSPAEFILKQNYPNPFNPSTRITYSISEAGLVTLLVYDMLGNEVARLVDENRGVGEYNVSFDASNLSNGIYLYRLQVNSNISIKKMVLLK
ncbi:MAG: hypothetical protein BMS9Abin39_0883 [Ignavibacteria bacterium]|nr:MAG: hypothetical protein BMS9Abin39_0883 [Ignavibacteria bacterium]